MTLVITDFLDKKFKTHKEKDLLIWQKLKTPLTSENSSLGEYIYNT